MVEGCALSFAGRRQEPPLSCLHLNSLLQHRSPFFFSLHSPDQAGLLYTYNVHRTRLDFFFVTTPLTRESGDRGSVALFLTTTSAGPVKDLYSVRRSSCRKQAFLQSQTSAATFILCSRCRPTPPPNDLLNPFFGEKVGHLPVRHSCKEISSCPSPFGAYTPPGELPPSPPSDGYVP